MFGDRLRILLHTVAAFIVAMTVGMAFADDSPRHQIANGADVYLGVVPAELAPPHPGMAVDTPRKKHLYHVLIALFDRTSGERITDADVNAEVSILGMDREQKKLLPIHQQEARSYGNFFRMKEPGKYRINVRITRPGYARIVESEFIFDRPRD